MNQVLLRGMSDEEFLRTVRNDAKTDLEVLLVERLETRADDFECDGDCSTAENLQKEVDDAKRFIAELCEFIQEERPNHKLLEDHLCPI